MAKLKPLNYPVFLKIEDEDELDILTLQLYNSTTNTEIELKWVKEESKGDKELKEHIIGMLEGKIQLLRSLIFKLSKLTSDEKKPKFG